MGLSPWCHGNLGKVPHHAVTLDDAKHAGTFLFEYAEMNALLLPGRVPGYKRTDLQVRKKGSGSFNKHASFPRLGFRILREHKIEHNKLRQPLSISRALLHDARRLTRVDVTSAHARVETQIISE